MRMDRRFKNLWEIHRKDEEAPYLQYINVIEMDANPIYFDHEFSPHYYNGVAIASNGDTAVFVPVRLHPGDKVGLIHHSAFMAASLFDADEIYLDISDPDRVGYFDVDGQPKFTYRFFDGHENLTYPDVLELVKENPDQQSPVVNTCCLIPQRLMEATEALGLEAHDLNN